MSVLQIINLLCGAALFLFGMTRMGDGLQRVSGSKLEPILFKLSGTPLRGVLLGTGVTAVIQSSSATSVMAVGFVNAGMMRVRQAVSVILGAILGTSITGWILCLSYIDSATGLSGLFSTATITGVVAVAGICLRLFSKKQARRSVGDILMGFAVLMFGMSTMSGAVSDLGKQSWFTSMLASMTNPLLGILVGTVFTAVLQSASAAVGVIQALSVTGAMHFDAALPLLMGICIGAAVPVVLSAIGARVDARRAAAVYPVATVLGVAVCSALFYGANAIFHFDQLMETVMGPVSVALVNTVYRLVVLCLLAPLSGALEKLVALLIPEKKSAAEKELALRLEERFLTHPALAIGQSMLAVSEMALQAQEAFQKAVDLLLDYDQSAFERVVELEAAGDRYEDALGSYLMRLTGRALTEQQGRESGNILRALADLERITDLSLNVAESAKELLDRSLTISDAAKADLSVVIHAVLENLRLATTAFVNGSQEDALRVEPLEEVIDMLCDECKARHVERLRLGICQVPQNYIFNDLLTNFERVSDHCSNLAEAAVEPDNERFEAHEYLDRLREKHSPEFDRYFDEYRRQYALAN
ncbi:MAG: Na/Pi cotransporter family protein [Oscillospiraceae bacterium]|nr:Na/Pi cotransporter family protein [Oscillospiraceae bacterium]